MQLDWACNLLVLTKLQWVFQPLVKAVRWNRPMLALFSRGSVLMAKYYSLPKYVITDDAPQRHDDDADHGARVLLSCECGGWMFEFRATILFHCIIGSSIHYFLTLKYWCGARETDIILWIIVFLPTEMVAALADPRHRSAHAHTVPHLDGEVRQAWWTLLAIIIYRAESIDNY